MSLTIVATTDYAPPDVARLREIGLFGGLSDEALADLAKALTLTLFEPGAAVVREGEAGREMYVILDGEAEVLRSGSHREPRVISVLGPGDWFGEMAMIDLEPRSATVRAVSALRALRLTMQEIKNIYRKDAKSYALLVLNVARQLSRRLRVADGLIAEHAGTFTTDPPPAK